MKNYKYDLIGLVVALLVIPVLLYIVFPPNRPRPELSAQGGSFNPMPPAEGGADMASVSNVVSAATNALGQSLPTFQQVTNILDARLLGAVFGSTGITNVWAGSRADYITETNTPAGKGADPKTAYFVWE